jgi:glycosyltransferase involved in cell wall biosynthesis
VTTGSSPFAMYARTSSPLFLDAAALVQGGAEVQYEILTRALARSGPVEVLVEPGDYQDRAHATFIPILWNPRLRTPVREISLLYGIVHALRRAESRVIVQHSLSPETFLVAMAARLLGRRFIFHWASDLDHRATHYRGLRRLVCLAGRRMAHLQVVQTQQQLNLLGQSRAKILPMAVDDAFFRRQAPGNCVLWVATIKPQFKQPMLFLDLAEQLPHRHFLMAGDVRGPDRFVRQITARMRSLPNVRHLGFVPRHALPAVFSQARCLVNTSSVEGFSNTFIEAMAGGVPIVSLNHDPDGVLAAGAGICTRGDIAALPVAVETMFGGAHREYQRNAYHQVQRYRSEVVAQQLRLICEEVGRGR